MVVVPPPKEALSRVHIDVGFGCASSPHAVTFSRFLIPSSGVCAVGILSGKPLYASQFESWSMHRRLSVMTCSKEPMVGSAAFWEMSTTFQSGSISLKRL
jgi:hypothetical protein